MAQIWENKINAISNNTVYNQPLNGTPTPSNFVSVTSNPITTIQNKLSNTTIISNNITSNISGTFNNSNNSLSNASTYSIQGDPKIATPQKFTYSKTN